MRAHERVFLWGAVALLGLFTVLLFVDAAGSPGLEQPLLITACAPADFDDDGSCLDDPFVDPDNDLPLELTDELRLEVAGRVRLSSSEPVPYQVTVAWESVTSSARYVVIDVPISWTDAEEPYLQAWAPPAQLLADVVGAEPGADLGRWRIVGVAEPVEASRYERYSWDSVRTFSLVMPG